MCLLRTGVVLSKHGGALDKMLPAFKFGLGGPIGHGKQGMSWIHIDDMIQLILFVLSHKDICGPINATALTLLIIMSLVKPWVPLFQDQQC